MGLIVIYTTPPANITTAAVPFLPLRPQLTT